MRYTNPANGDHAMPTIGTYIQLLPKAFKTSRYRRRTPPCLSPWKVAA
jgi:gentisate 1,2-dioxygenase